MSYQLSGGSRSTRQNDILFLRFVITPRIPNHNTFHTFPPTPVCPLTLQAAMQMSDGSKWRSVPLASSFFTTLFLLIVPRFWSRLSLCSVIQKPYSFLTLGVFLITVDKSGKKWRKFAWLTKKGMQCFVVAHQSVSTIKVDSPCQRNTAMNCYLPARANWSLPQTLPDVC
jgi:hypothetical protein